MRKFIKTLKNSLIGKIFKIVFTVLKWALELFIIGIAVVVLTQRLTNNQKSFLGYRIFNVVTGSMEPEYAVGDILISKEKDPSLIQVGENIVYVGRVADYRGKIITHGVVRKEQDENGDYLFYTKGIANTMEDPVVHEDQLYGTVVSNNVVLAWICRIITNKYGLYFVVIVPLILYGFTELIRIQGEKIEQEREEEEERKRKRREKRRREREAMAEQERLAQEETIEEELEEQEKIQKPKTTRKKKQENLDDVEEKKTQKTTKTSTTSKKENKTKAESEAKAKSKTEAETKNKSKVADTETKPKRKTKKQSEE